MVLVVVKYRHKDAVDHTVTLCERSVTKSCCSDVVIYVDSSSEEEVAQPTKLSQFLKAPSPTPEKTDHPSSSDGHKEARSDRSERDRRNDRQAGRNERASEQEYAETQQRLLALAEYGDQPGNDRDSRDRTVHSQHKSSSDRSKNSRSPGHRRH